MSEQDQNGQVQVQEEGEQQMTLSELKDSIYLSANKLLELTYSEEKYINTIIKFNDLAIDHINQQEQEEALVYLAEAQRTLEYGASCGKSIDRNLIICILNNQACCYYREGQLAKCASYLEGVIYNLKAFGTSMESSPTGSSLLQKNRLKNVDEFYHVSLERKIELIHYSLRYCTINSQLGKRQVALQAGHNVVKLVKSLFSDFLYENPKIYPVETAKQEEELKELKELIKSQIFLKEQINCEELDTYRKLARIYVKKWNERKISNRINRDFQKHIRDYSISQVIDILPIHYVSNNQTVYQGLANTRVIIRQLLHICMGYFTISTEHRLLAEHRYPSSVQEKHKSDEWRSANIYHLFGIIFLGLNLNSDLLFMKQLISSYQQHYKFQLLLDEHMPDEELQSLSQKLLFEAKKQKKHKQSEILFEKISKLKEKEDRKSHKQKQEKKSGQSKSKDPQYKTLNSTKLNISKDMTPQVTRKRSISKQQTTRLSSSKKISEKNSMNNSAVTKTKLINESQNKDSILPSRKRSYSKDSVKGIKPTVNLGMQKGNQAEKTANQYQLETPSKKPMNQRKRRVSSVSSGKDIVVQRPRQTSKHGKILASKQKQKILSFNNERLRSPTVKIAGSTTKGKIEKNKQKETKQKKKVDRNEKEKQTKKIKAAQKKSYYF